MTCSLASTVLHAGHQFTAALACTARPALEELEEDPLRPPVVAGSVVCDLVAPVDHQADALELRAEVLDVARDQLGGVRPDLEREVLGVDAEGVEAQRLEDVVALPAAGSAPRCRRR